MAIEFIRSLDETLLTRMVFAIAPSRIAQELSRLNRRVYFRYFKGYRPDKISRKKVLAAVRKEIIEGEDEKFAELLALAWNANHWELYEAMRRNVAKINPDVEKIKKIEDEQAEVILADLTERGYEREDIYLCTRLNDVRFTPDFIRNHVDPAGPPPKEEAADEAPAEPAATEEAPAAPAEADKIPPEPAEAEKSAPEQDAE